MATPRYHGPSPFLRRLRFADRNASLRLAARHGNTGRFGKFGIPKGGGLRILLRDEAAGVVFGYMGNNNSEGRLHRIEDCREIFLKYEGERHEMIERYGWNRLLNADARRRIAVGEDGSPPYKGAVDAASADGVVLSSAITHSTSGGNATVMERVSANNTLAEPDMLLDFDEFLVWLKQVSPTMEWEWRHQVPSLTPSTLSSSRQTATPSSRTSGVSEISWDAAFAA